MPMRRKNLPTERESSVQRSAVQILGSMGIMMWRRNVGAFHVQDRYIRCAKPGQSDLWGTDFHRLVESPGGWEWSRHWELETKSHGKRPNPEQLAWLKASTDRGWVAYWGDNVDTIVRVAQAILDGGQIVWHNDDSYHVEMR